MRTSRSNELHRLLSAVRDQAIFHQSSVATPSHLLLALIRDPRTPASRLLVQVGLDIKYLSELLIDSIHLVCRNGSNPFGVSIDDDCDRLIRRAYSMVAGDKLRQPGQFYLHCLAAIESESGQESATLATVLLHDLIQRAKQSTPAGTESHSDSFEKDLSTSGA